MKRVSAFVGLLFWMSASYAGDVDDARKALMQGQFDKAIQLSGNAIRQRVFGEDCYLIKTEAELSTGRYSDAFETITGGIARYGWSVRMRQVGVEAAHFAGNPEQVKAWQSDLNEIVLNARGRYEGDPESLVALGKAAVAAGVDARQVLERFYDRALIASPQHRNAILASGELALSKRDFALAAETFEAGLKSYAEDPDLHFGLARSIDRTQPKLAAFHLSETLRLNPNHTAAMLYKAEQLIDAEQYATAGELLDKILEVNESHPLAWSLHAVMAHLDNQKESEQKFRETALKHWAENPAVDHLIGRKLSQKYRFAEGAAYQQNALKMDSGFQPARAQLVQDLLRLGQEDAGWLLNEAALKADPYDVHLFNLSQLRDELGKYTTIDVEGFRVRMESREARVYGRQLISLLQRARKTLGEKYDLKQDNVITVEIFADSNDFAVRAFNLPGAGGYLGVCFGKVIVANSPAASQQITSNWQSTLWHEYCHVVTLEKTKNRMPRWLSEGISVYEERQAAPTWGQRMNPKHRQRIIKGQVSSVREMSGMFLRPDTPGDLEFAYFQSSLLVQNLIEKYGLAAMKSILNDLAEGVHVEDAIARHTAPLDQIDAEFRDYALEMARRLAPDLDWEQYDLSAIKDDDDPDRLEHWVEDHPNSTQGLTMLADQMVSRREYQKAKRLLTKLIELYPEQTGVDSSYLMLASIHRELGEVDAEQKVLEQFVEQANDAKSALLRLIEIQATAKQWASVSKTVEKLLEVNPMLPQAQKARAAAHEALGNNDEAIDALQSWLLLEPDDPADAHYRLAKLLYAKKDAGARSHVLAALDYAPRFRDAQRLLLKMVRESPGAPVDAQNPENGIQKGRRMFHKN